MKPHATSIAALLRALVRIDSRTPGALRDPVPPGTVTEADICAFVAAWLEARGFAVGVHCPAPRRPNLVALRRGPPGAPTLAFEAHFDTVGTTGMTHDPFACELRDGRMYGRGTADTKGAMAAMLVALERLTAAGAPPLNLLFIGACAEETGCEGIRFLELGELCPDAVIVGEPTSNQPVVGHKAHLWFELTAHGRAAHGSCPEAGDNAIYRMQEVIAALRAYDAEVLRPATHPGFTPATLSVDMISGGTKVNIIPERCAIQVDTRLLPGHDLDQALAAMLAAARTRAGGRIEVTWSHAAPGFAAPADSPLLAALTAGLAAAGRRCTPTTVNYCTDAGVLAGRGLSCVVFGPGSILQAHGAEEYIDLAEAEAAATILEQTARAFAAPAATRRTPA